jgi:hypothetical protein
MVLYSARRIRIMKMCILIVLMLALLSGPLMPLYQWAQGIVDGIAMAKMMVLQVSCTLLFGVVLALCTKARKHEIFTACAG